MRKFGELKGWACLMAALLGTAGCAQNGKMPNLPSVGDVRDTLGGLVNGSGSSSSPSSPSTTTGGIPDILNSAPAQCGVATAAVVYATCTAVEHKPAKVCLPRSVLFATGGALVCSLVDDALVKRNEQLKGHENDLRAQIEYIRGVNQDVADSNAKLQAAIEETSKRTDALKTLVADKQATQEQIANERKVQDQDLQAAQRRLNQQKAALDEVKSFKAKQKTPSPELDTEIAKQEKLYAATQGLVNDLASVRKRV